MPKLEDVLREQTYKEEGMEVEQRVFYTLHDGEKHNLQAHRNSKAIALVISILHQKNMLTEEELDDLLLGCIN